MHLDLITPPARHDQSGPPLLLLPGGGQRPADFLEHVDVLDPDRRWHVAALSPWVASDLGPLWYEVRPAYDLDQVTRSVEAVAAAVRRLAAETGTDPEEVVVAGFSQGAAIAASLLLERDLDVVPRATAVLGGYLLPRPGRQDAGRARGRTVLCAHGRDDVGIVPDRGRELARLLRSAGADVRWRWCDGGHRIAPHLVVALRDWLAMLLGGATAAERTTLIAPEPSGA